MEKRITKMVQSAAPQKILSPKLRFYRNKRIIGAALVSLIALCLTGNVIVWIHSYIGATLVLDWYLFSFKGYKESTPNSPELLQQTCDVTPEQLDQYTNFTLKVRRISVVVSGVIAVITMLMMTDDFLAEIAFSLSYALLSIGITAGAVLFGYVSYPYGLATGERVVDCMPDNMKFGRYNPLSNSTINNPFAAADHLKPGGPSGFID
ncbi:MAG: hypothetical protein K0M45_06185 [Candidatus Paracaedibacteraceae bacterium]|nr:hypothetical protein [Candidatus Paracaedibacteraceae bacterium]